MAFTLRTSTTRTNSADGTISTPTGAVVGDVLILQMSTGFDAQAGGDPTGAFTFLDQQRIASGAYSSIWYKVLTSAPAASYNVYRGTAAMTAIAGSDFNTLAVSGHTGQANTAATTATTPGLTPTYASSLCLLFFQGGIGGNVFSAETIANTPPSFTESYDTGGGSGTGDQNIAMASGPLTSTGTTGNGTATLSSNANTGQMVILNPAQSPAVSAPLFAPTINTILFPFNVPLLKLTVSLYANTFGKWRNQAKRSTSWRNKTKS